MTRKSAVRLLVLWLPLLGGSACYAQGRFSQATPISGSQFFAALKAVSLDLRSDPSLAKYIPLAEQQNEIVKALAGYGIAVRPNMQVTLVVTVIHHDPVIESKSVTTGQVEESTVVHGIYMVTEFFLKAAALRNGKLHPVMAAPGLSWSGSDQAEDSGVRKFLLGDQTRQDIRNRFVRIFGECLQGITKDTDPQDTPWFVDSWTEKARAAADADYVKLMSPSTPVDKNPLEGLSSAPLITLLPRFNGLEDYCKADPDWNGEWTRVFQRLGWTGSQPPRVALTHIFSCVYAFGLAAPRYFALSDLIYLLQSDLVFELNGRPVRKWGVLYLTHHEKLALEDTMKEQLADFTPRNIQNSLTDLVLGNGPDTRAIPSGTQSSSGGAAPNTAAPGGGSSNKPISTADADAQNAKDRMLQAVREDVAAYIEASKTGFEAYKKGEAQMSQGFRRWDSSVKPLLANGCWVFQGATAANFTCVIPLNPDLNGARSFYTQISEDVTASLPRDWSPDAAPPFGGDLPSKGYRSSSGARGEVWLAHAESDGGYELHYELDTAPSTPRPAVNPPPPADDPIGVGGFITPPDR